MHSLVQDLSSRRRSQDAKPALMLSKPVLFAPPLTASPVLTARLQVTRKREDEETEAEAPPGRSGQGWGEAGVGHSPARPSDPGCSPQAGGRGWQAPSWPGEL